ncbi:hypothetical protein C477_22675 [Haloterrigena salina JCM 13891]|uniref:Blue (Type 1) copper domain-containing protein n=1 Tax=Haloterrigena salina JCM 13891 TaxID=1227488 RepID=M0BUG2_9EURY|nr:twin-arginine translocation signal domain-containing protein [Haloterrigena salina]ELZ13309.1 hypothetical protein C477_22675 [Haloterrigena salina JCM 13891]
MTEHTRRTVLKAAGASTLAVAVAGCTGGDDDSDDENGDESGDDTYEIDAGETIMLEGQIGGWTGLQPAAIEDVENPTLVLEADAEYEIGWEPGDSASHNIELWDENEELVDEAYKLELTSDPDETLSFTASEDIAYYRCNPHSNMQGEIRVE